MGWLEAEPPSDAAAVWLVDHFAVFPEVVVVVAEVGGGAGGELADVVGGGGEGGGEDEVAGCVG